MASEPEPSVQLIRLFNTIIFGSLTMVGMLVLLASLLKIFELWWWLSDSLREYRARRGIDDARAQNVGDGMLENHVVESRVVDNCPRRGEGPGTNAEGLRPPKKFTEQRV